MGKRSNGGERPKQKTKQETKQETKQSNGGRQPERPGDEKSSALASKKRNPSLVARFVSEYMLSKSAFVNFLLRLNNVSREEVKWFKVST